MNTTITHRTALAATAAFYDAGRERLNVQFRSRQVIQELRSSWIHFSSATPRFAANAAIGVL